MKNSTALVPTWRSRRAFCARCKAIVLPSSEDHICHDYVRHPGMGLFFDSMLILEAVRHHEVSIDTALDIALATSFAYANLPDSEKVVANAILKHAGVEPVHNEC